jgi:hypothetical protein
MENEGSLPSLSSLAAWTVTHLLASYLGSPGLIGDQCMCGHKMAKEQILF